MNRIAKTAVALGLATAIVGTAGVAAARGFHDGACRGGPGMEGHGRMSSMMGPLGMFGPDAKADKQLTGDDAKAIINGFVAMRGNKRLKAGEVTEKDADTLVADVVTVDNSLVQRFEINRKTGRFTPIQ